MSEIFNFEAHPTTGLDTVRFKTPYMARAIVDLIKDQGESYCQISNESGERMWEITRTNPNGTFDSRIKVGRDRIKLPTFCV